MDIKTDDFDVIRDKAHEISGKLAEVKALADDLTSMINVLKIKCCPEYRESLRILDDERRRRE